MERIDPSSRSYYSPADKSGRKTKRKGVGAMTFDSALASTSESHSDLEYSTDSQSDDHRRLEEMLDDIYSIGEEVKANPGPASVKAYRNAVASFMEHVVRSALSLEERQSGPSVSRRKKFTLIKIIDQELQKLAAGVLANQQGAFDVLARIDEIHGLLVDLVT